MTSAPEINRAIGDANRERIRAWMILHLGGTNAECADALGMNVCVIGRHVKRLRAEWLPPAAQDEGGQP